MKHLISGKAPPVGTVAGFSTSNDVQEINDPKNGKLSDWVNDSMINDSEDKKPDELSDEKRIVAGVCGHCSLADVDREEQRCEYYLLQWQQTRMRILFTAAATDKDTNIIYCSGVRTQGYEM